MAFTDTLKRVSRDVLETPEGWCLVCISSHLAMVLGWILFVAITDDGKFLRERACNFFRIKCSEKGGSGLLSVLIICGCYSLIGLFYGIQKIVELLEAQNWGRVAHGILTGVRAFLFAGFAMFATYIGSAVPLRSSSFAPLLIVTWACYFALTTGGIREDFGLMDAFGTINLCIAINMHDKHKFTSLVVASISGFVKSIVPAILAAWRQWAADDAAEDAARAAADAAMAAADAARAADDAARGDRPNERAYAPAV